MSEVTESILFRQKLYDNFKQSGLLSKLKTSLRTSLLQKLHKPQSIQFPDNSNEKQKPIYLRDKFMACIVGEYLRKTNKEYTLSILLPESNLEDRDCLNFNELAEIVNLNQIQEQGRSFLEILVQEWTKFRATGVCERSTQTDYSEPVSKKLEEIDKQYRSKIDYWKLIPSKPIPTTSSELQLLAKQERMKEEFEIEKKRMRQELELSIKAEINKKIQTEYDFRAKQMQKLHDGRLFQMKNRQKMILEGLERKRKDVQEKARKINEDQLKMIKKYENKISEIEIDYARRVKDLEGKEKEFWKKQLELKAKKREYEDSIRLVRQQVLQQAGNT